MCVLAYGTGNVFGLEVQVFVLAQWFQCTFGMVIFDVWVHVSVFMCLFGQGGTSDLHWP